MDNLPMELVLRIVSESGLNLFVIAQLSRSFNSLATSQYFHARPDHHIDSLTLHFDGLKTTVSPQCTFSKTFQATDVLSLLSIAFDIQTVGKFVWAVISTDPLIPGRRLISYYHHLTTFLRRLKHVDHISLDFHGRETGRTVHIVLPSRLDEWTVAMTDLLNACVETLKMNPNGAEGFSVKGGLPLIGHEAEPGREQWWRLNPKILGFFKHTPNPSLRGTDQGLNFRIPRITSSTRRIITSPGAHSVLKRTKKFTISSSTLLHPPLCGWTHEFLSSATLNSLTLDGLHYYEGWWRAMLPWLATPLQRLEEFTIQRCQNVPAISLAKFLHNLRGLKHCNIEIDPNYQVDLDSTSFHPPNLITFVAPCDFLYLTGPKGFQFSKRLVGIASSLTTLTVVIDLLQDDLHTEQVLNAFANIPRIIVDLRSDSYCYLEFSDWPSFLNRESGEKPLIPRCYGLVKEVVVSEKGIDWMTKTTGFLPRFLEVLGVFSGLEVLRVAGSDNAISQTLESGVDGLRTVHNYEWIRPPCLDSLKRTCRTLQVIELSGIDGTIVLHKFEQA